MNSSPATVADVSLRAAAGVFERFARLRAAQGHLSTVLMSAVQVFGIRLAGAGITYASMVLLARWLGAHDFGVYAYVSVVVTLLGIALSFGFGSSALRFVASYAARAKTARLSGFLKTSFTIVAALSALGAIAGAALVVVFRGAIQSYYVAPLLVGLVCVPVWTLLNQFEATARAFGWVHVAYVPGYIVRPSALVILLGGFVLLGGTADATAAVWAMVGACLLAAIVQGALVLSRMRATLPRAKSALHTRHWLAVSLGFLAIDGFRIALDNTDVLLIGRFLDPHSVAIYFAVVRTCGFVAFVSFSVIALAVPKFSAIHSTGTRDELQAFVTNVVRMMFWPSLVMAGALALAGPFVLSLFGKDFVAGYPTMLVVLAGLVLRSATGPVEHLLNATGHHRDTIYVYAGAAAAAIVLNLVLIPTFGIVGAAVASYAAMLSGNACLYVLVRKRLGVSAFVLPLRRDRLRAASAG